MFKCKKGTVGAKLSSLLEQMQSQDPTEKRTVALQGLPHVLGDHPEEFLKASFDGDESFDQTDIGILMLFKESGSPSLRPSSLKIVIEGQVVMDNLSNLPETICLLFGLTYGLHLDYPKRFRNTLLFIQQVFFSLGNTELRSRIQTLKNQLQV
ncbi:hypothetical protein NL108_003807 [Boleophthalmus pectinirostris]|nr:hypothetical protein NL108_018421 [Boleophthalmus pectinirostris]KAJ0055446.1 hypothetical protein NL108_003807 [Boleophthalmus pectinirostris]